MTQITVDGTTHIVKTHQTLLEALREIGANVPTLCHDDRLDPHPVCRMCIVEIEGRPHPVPSCWTKLEDGMVVRTRSATIEADRRISLTLLAHRVPPQDIAARGEDNFSRYLRESQLESALHGISDPAKIDDSHPYLHVDMSRCINCFRCVRICDEVQGQSVWTVWNRGAADEIHPDKGTNLLESSCVSCGACSTACPTGAISDKSVIERGLPTAHTRTTCPYCGVGCELDVGTRNGKIVQILPAADAPVNKGHTCVKGRYAFGFVESPERLTDPQIRTEDGWRNVSWDEAIGYIADRLKRIIETHGPDSVGVLGSARSTNEENYVAQKFARTVLGTNNVDCCARVCHAPSAKALGLMLGTGAATSSYDDIERASTILLCGVNPTEGHPVVGARLRQRAKSGAALIVVDPRKTEIARVPGAIHLRVRPGGNVALFNAMAAVIVEEGLVDRTFIQDRVDAWETYREFILRFRPEAIEASTGVEAALVRKAARLYATHTPSICFHGLGMTEHVQGTDGVMTLVNLALLTGNVGKPGTGVNPLRGQNNVQGSAHMGCEPSGLTGLSSVEESATLFEQVWKSPIPRGLGKRMSAMLDEAAAGRFKAIWGMGYDVLMSNPHVSETRRSLEGLDLLVIQDIFLSETAREYAHVILPSACSYEKDGTFMNAERRVQRVRKAVDAPGLARTDWEPLCDLARAMGRGEGFAFTSAEEIWEEIRQVWPAGRGISYARLEERGIQWPCPDESHPGTSLLHVDSFGKSTRATLRSIDHSPTLETTSDEYPFILNTGRSLFHFNAGTMTMRTRNRILRPTDQLDMSPRDGERLGLHDGEKVRLKSRFGESILELHLDGNLAPGEVFATFSDATTWLNAVLGSRRDTQTDTPEYKLTAVRVEKV